MAFLYKMDTTRGRSAPKIRENGFQIFSHQDYREEITQRREENKDDGIQVAQIRGEGRQRTEAAAVSSLNEPILNFCKLM